MVEENENYKKIIADLKNIINEKDEIIKKNKEKSIKEKNDYEQKIKSALEMNISLENQYNELNNKYNTVIHHNPLSSKNDFLTILFSRDNPQN